MHYVLDQVDYERQMFEVVGLGTFELGSLVAVALLQKQVYDLP